MVYYWINKGRLFVKTPGYAGGYLFCKIARAYLEYSKIIEGL